MKRVILFCVIFFLFSAINIIKAQQWSRYNPTSGFDINSIAIPELGVISIGGGWETNDSVQIMFQTTDYCATWIENAHDGLAPWNKSIAFSDNLNGYAVGYNGNIIKSDDAGQNWGWNVHPINRSLNKIVYVAGGTYYIAGGNKSHDSIQTIIKSKDYGHTWNIIYDTAGPWLKSLYFKDTLNGFAVGDNGVILSTSDGGNTFSAIASPLQRDFNGIAFTNADTGFIVGGTTSGICKRTILRTIDGGINWTIFIDETGGILKDISFADLLVGFIVGDSSTVLKTVDGGFTWNKIIVDSNMSNNESFNAVKFHNKNFGAIGGKSGIFYMYLNKPVEVYTIGISQIDSTTATIQGGINTNTKNSKYQFVYTPNKLFTTSDTTLGVYINNDSLLLVSKQIQGLISDTTYYYFLKATFESEIIIGDTLSFYTGNSPITVFQTYDATEVNTWSVKLNGFVNNLRAPVNLYFEYGTSPAFGNQIAANPNLVNDTLSHEIKIIANALQSHKQYYFRLKGISGSEIFLGDTKMFYSASMPYITTQNAETLSPTSVRLNGVVSNNGLPSAIKFEYGTTVLYGNEVDGAPDSVFNYNNINSKYILTGLTPFTVYHYRVKVINPNGIGYGNDKVFSVGQPSAYTSFASNTTPSSAQLNGNVNANNFPTVVTFEYGLSSSFGSETAAIPDSVFGATNVNTLCQLTGLQPNSTYYFRIKAKSIAGTTYGDQSTFVAAYPFSVSTLSASNIDFNSATLNGVINTGGSPAAVKFEYGLDTLYGNEIFATPDSFSSFGYISTFADIAELNSNTYYHYRLKATNSYTTRFGEDMIFYTGFSEIPNFDFENWTPLLMTKPHGWDLSFGSITQSIYVCHGSSSVKIQNVVSQYNSQPGAILMGKTYDEGHSFEGGVPFDARPDTLIGCFNYLIENNDTALILLKLKKQGLTISENWFKIYGNSSGMYQNLKFPIQYTSGGNADSLIIAITSTDFRNMTVPPIASFLIVDYIRFSGTNLTIPNNDFEDWDSDTLNMLDKWYYNNRISANPDHQNDYPVSRTTDAHHGDYAVLIQNFLYPDDTLRSGIYTADQNLGWSVPSFSVNARHKLLTGYYKFFPENNDTLNFFVMMFKNHNWIGSGSYQATSEVLYYRPFTVNINYNSLLIPDSCYISIQASSRNTLGNSKLYIDNLNFDGFLSGTKETEIVTADNFDFIVYPNPFSEQATISFSISNDENITVRLFDLSGKMVVTLANGKYKAGEYKINLSSAGLAKGFYICHISTEDKAISKKLIIY